MLPCLKFTLINPETGQPGAEAYVDVAVITCWQEGKTKRDKAITVININSGMGFAYQVDESFHVASARILEARAADPLATIKAHKDATETHRTLAAAEAAKKLAV